MLLALCGLVLCQEHMVAQSNKCGDQILKDNIIARDPQNAALMLHRIEQIAAKADAYEQSTKTTAQKTTSVVRIPIVFHVVLTTAQLNQLGNTAGIRARMISQIQVLNEDFEKLNSDTSLIPAVFKPLAAKTGIQFGAAHRKPDGSSTEGFEIKIVTTTSYDINDGWGASTAKHATTDGLDAWDPTKYLNIWLLNITPNGILGFTSPPSFINFGMPPNELGVVLNYGAFGKRNSITQFFISNIDKGRTLTHELGHYFELEHIWGDDNGLCPGAGGSDDGIADTPPQASENFGNPTFPNISCSNGPNGDMFMNYMDYSNDASLHMFTTQQANRMKSNVAVGAESYSLTLHPELMEWPTAVTEINNGSLFEIYPNPSSGKFQINISETKDLQRINVLNMIGQIIYSFAANNSQISNHYDIDLTGMSKGVYMVQCTFAAGTVTKKIILQ